MNEKIQGVGKDAPMEINQHGGKQSKVDYAFDALDPKAMFATCKVLMEGRIKYGDDENWRKIDIREHINHALIHLFAYLAGDRQDEHLSHAMCRVMFALGTEGMVFDSLNKTSHQQCTKCDYDSMTPKCIKCDVKPENAVNPDTPKIKTYNSIEEFIDDFLSDKI